MDFVRHVLLAVEFFTRIPLPQGLAQWAAFSPQRLRAALGHWPLVGALVGGAMVLAVLGARWLWGAGPVLPAALLALLCAGAATLCAAGLTAAMHEDGLADVADALGGSATTPRALEIMKDSRLGSYGVLALVLGVGAKVLLLAALCLTHLQLGLAVLFSAQMLSRFFALLVGRFLPYAGVVQAAKASALTQAVASSALGAAALWCVPLLALRALPQGAWLLGAVGAGSLAAGALAALLRQWFLRRLGGFTGDCLGAAQQLCELAFYAAALGAALHSIA